MPTPFGLDAYTPAEIAERVQNVGVVKARLPLLQMSLLGVLAGAFIGLGALYFTLIVADTGLGFAAGRVLGGLAFSLGLLMVSVAGAELFTGNNLLAMAWADGRIRTTELLRNWLVVCCANFVGAAGLAVLVWQSGHLSLHGGQVGQAALRIAVAKSSLPWFDAFMRGVLCNLLVCMAVWMAMAGRSVTDKAVAIVLPVSAFVAAGFEHSVANMYFLPLGLLLKASGLAVAGSDAVTPLAMIANLLPVIAGNLVGGSVLVALVYYLIYRRPRERDDQDRGG